MSSQYHRKKSSKRTNEWSDWGPWVWSQTYERYYRQRQDINGNKETMWATEHNTPAVTDTDPRQQPRRPTDDQADLVEQVSRLGIDDAGEEDEGGEAAYSEYSHMPSSHSSSKHRGKSSSGKGKSKSSSSSSSKKKSKSAYTTDETIEEQEEEEDAGAQYDGGNADPYEEETQNYPSYQTDPSSGNYGRTYQSATYQSAYGEEQQADTYDADFDEARQQSLRDHQPHSSHQYRGESSRHQESSSSHRSRRGQQAGYTTAEYGAGEYGYEGGGSEGAITPKGPGRFDISGNEGDYEALDPRYRVEPSHRFQPGEVFKVLWPEPTGQTVGGTPTISDTQKIKNKYGESFYIGFRRFIVIANDQGHCQCVPILTYGGKGCNKRGVKPDKHGIVYDHRGRARPLPGEPEMRFPAVRLVVEVEGESLAKASRVNYSKIVTVEHNVKVFFIGHIAPDDYQLASDAVNTCWEDKVFQRRKHGRGKEN